MNRPYKERRVEHLPPYANYKPVGGSSHNIGEVTLTIEEMEAIRLADIEQLNQATAAERMEVSMLQVEKQLSGKFVNHPYRKPEK